MLLGPIFNRKIPEIDKNYRKQFPKSQLKNHLIQVPEQLICDKKRMFHKINDFFREKHKKNKCEFYVKCWEKKQNFMYTKFLLKKILFRFLNFCEVKIARIRIYDKIAGNFSKIAGVFKGGVGTLSIINSSGPSDTIKSTSRSIKSRKSPTNIILLIQSWLVLSFAFHNFSCCFFLNFYFWWMLFLWSGFSLFLSSILHFNFSFI